MNRAPHLGRLLCWSKFESQHINHEVENCEKNCASCKYLLKAQYINLNELIKPFYWKISITVKALICFMLPFAKEEKQNI